MGGPTIALCIAGIVIGVAVICYVLFRTPKAPANLPVSEIVFGDEEEAPVETVEAEEKDK